MQLVFVVILDTYVAFTMWKYTHFFLNRHKKNFAIIKDPPIRMHVLLIFIICWKSDGYGWHGLGNINNMCL